jgi:hypothetical protein
VYARNTGHGGVNQRRDDRSVWGGQPGHARAQEEQGEPDKILPLLHIL